MSINDLLLSDEEVLNSWSTDIVEWNRFYDDSKDKFYLDMIEISLKSKRDIVNKKKEVGMESNQIFKMIEALENPKDLLSIQKQKQYGEWLRKWLEQHDAKLIDPIYQQIEQEARDYAMKMASRGEQVKLI